MAEPHMVQIIDLARWHVDKEGEVYYDRHPANAEREKYVRLPMDFPGYLRALRITKEGRTNGAAILYDPVATTLEINCFTFGVKVYVRAGKDGTLKVFTEDADGREVVGEWQR